MGSVQRAVLELLNIAGKLQKRKIGTSSVCVISDGTIFSIGETSYLKMKTKIKNDILGKKWAPFF